MYRLYILDFDGTIADTNQIITQTMQATLVALGLPERSRAACSATIGLPLKECFKTLMPMEDALAERCTETYKRLFDENNKPGAAPAFPGALEAIRRWHERGAIISIASSRDHDTLDGFVDALGLTPYVSLILAGEDVERAKPDPCPVLMTLEHFQVSPKDALVIGDMTYDVLMGSRAGCPTAAVTYGNGTPEELRQAGAGQLVDSLLEIE